MQHSIVTASNIYLFLPMRNSKSLRKTLLQICNVVLHISELGWQLLYMGTYISFSGFDKETVSATITEGREQMPSS